MSEYVTLEFYDVAVKGDEALMHASDVIYVPRVGDKLYLARTEQVLGIDPDKEHRYWEVVGVEAFYSTETHAMVKYGTTRQIVVYCRRLKEKETFIPQHLDFLEVGVVN